MSRLPLVRPAMIASAVGLIAFLLVSGPARASDDEPPTWTVGLSATYSRGDFGTGVEQELVYAPLSVWFTPVKRFTLSVHVPYVQANEPTTRIGAGETRDDRGTRRGLGDITLEARYTAVQEHGRVPSVFPFASVKFPTADRDEGLGTEEFDYRIGVEAGKTLTDRWAVFGNVSYTFIGDPPDEELTDSVGWSIGPIYQFTPAFFMSAYVEGWTPAFPKHDNAVALRLGGEYTLARRVVLAGSVAAGVAPGAPDLSVTVGLRYRF